MAKLGFGELELSILKIVRECGRVTVREVYEKLGTHNSQTNKYAFTTFLYSIQKNIFCFYFLGFWNCFLSDFFREVLDVLRSPLNV